MTFWYWKLIHKTKLYFLLSLQGNKHFQFPYLFLYDRHALYYLTIFDFSLSYLVVTLSMGDLCCLLVWSGSFYLLQCLLIPPFSLSPYLSAFFDSCRPDQVCLVLWALNLLPVLPRVVLVFVGWKLGHLQPSPLWIPQFTAMSMLPVSFDLLKQPAWGLG